MDDMEAVNFLVKKGNKYIFTSWIHHSRLKGLEDLMDELNEQEANMKSIDDIMNSDFDSEVRIAFSLHS